MTGEPVRLDSLKDLLLSKKRSHHSKQHRRSPRTRNTAPTVEKHRKVQFQEPEPLQQSELTSAMELLKLQTALLEAMQKDARNHRHSVKKHLESVDKLVGNVDKFLALVENCKDLTKQKIYNEKKRRRLSLQPRRNEVDFDALEKMLSPRSEGSV